jgi:hypothetical protein
VKNVSHSRRLREDAFELDENGVLAIRLVVDLIAALNPMEESCIGQLPEFALGCPIPVPARREISPRPASN